MVETKQLESLAYRMKDLLSLRKVFEQLNYDFADEPVDKEGWSDDQSAAVIESRIIVKKDDYLVYYIQTNTDSLKVWKGIASRIIKDKHGLCLVCSHNPRGFKWVFSSISREFSKSFSETRHIPIEIRPEAGVPKTFIEFLEKMDAKGENSSTLATKISKAFDMFALQIHDELTVSVFDAVKVLAEGLILERSNNLELSKETLEAIREPIFIMLYRIMFALYAEDRAIFPTEDKIYYERFSLKRLSRELLSEPDLQKNLKEYEVHNRVRNLSNLIELGSESAGYDPAKFFMISYYGRLFDRKVYPELEKWKIPNKNMLDAISLLTRTRDSKGNYFFLDYAALETRHLGSIYERLLEFHLVVSGKKIADLPNPKVRKSSGSYYTPEYIVDYIVKNSIGQLIDNITKQTSDKGEQIERILSLNVLDPAMGSGHFLVGAMNYMASRICEIEDGEVTEKRLLERKRDVARLCIYGVDVNPLAVDLAMVSLWLETLSSDKPLSFLSAHLKCGNSLLGSEIETLFDKQTTLMESQKGRDQFKRTIKDFLMFEDLEDDTASAVRTKMERYGRILSKGTIYYDLKFLLDCKTAESLGVKIPAFGDYKARIGENSLDYFTEPLLQEVKRLSTDLKFFHWELEFPNIFHNEKGDREEGRGFDVIIGNPPYIKEYTNRQIFENVKRCTGVAEYYQGKMDFWYFFTSKSIDLLAHDGLNSFIAQNNWITSFGASKMRNKILTETEISSFIDFGDFKVFEDAGIQTMIFVLRMKMPRQSYSVDYSIVVDDTITEDELSRYLLSKVPSIKVKHYGKDITPSNLMDKTIDFAPSEFEKVLEKIVHRSNYQLHEDVVKQGIVAPQEFVIESHLELLNDARIAKGNGIFVLSTEELSHLKLSQKEKQMIKPFYTTEQLHRFCGLPDNKLWIIYADRDVRISIKEYPRIKEHLDKFKKIMTSDFAPYGLHRARDEQFFEGKKILCLRKASEPFFTYTEFPCYVSQTYIIIKPVDINLKYLTGLLNSKLIHFWLDIRGKKQGKQLQLDSGPLLNLPLYQPNDTKNELTIQYEITQIVEALIKIGTSIIMSEDQLKTEILKKQVSDLEKRLNEQVYSLYNLTAEEIELIKLRLNKHSA